ncbi:Rap1a/Tai family immunity protein [Pseudoduganella sp. SL102]|uniref:Rap1a/Tai family immunity protein n=1 Tax=Pseudoduganella sp. SL102 TaxID=2995154 RepID=UPI00248C18E9|nr:Rap1a/Tai family immunity protein [Pseudoduganella sp. SL102]WBS04205.1 Rap1a/Tai family immunity protein [Pseudoduganella sp. SL102]
MGTSIFPLHKYAAKMAVNVFMATTNKHENNKTVLPHCFVDGFDPAQSMEITSVANFDSQSFGDIHMYHSPPPARQCFFLQQVPPSHQFQAVIGLKEAALLIISGFVTLFPSVAHTKSAYAYTLTGDRFIQMIGSTKALDSYEYTLREKAYSYLDGVRDGAEGHDWCDVNQLKTPDLAYELAADIARLPAAERKKNASILLLDLLRRRFPCPVKGGNHEAVVQSGGTEFPAERKTRGAV